MIDRFNIQNECWAKNIGPRHQFIVIFLKIRENLFAFFEVNND